MNSRLPSEDEIFAQALQLSGEQRAAYLREVTGENTALRRRIELLLQANERAGDFLDQPVAASADTFVVTTNMIPVTEKPGDKIGRYKLREKIGEGGCGVVYVAEQEEPVRCRVALKIIKLGMDTKQVVARFEAERQALALMDHPNIAKVLDAGATETGRPFFVMELVRGIRITDYCDKNNLPTEERLKLFVRVCSAVQHAHQKGIIHRDIKPSNILVTLHDGVPVPKVIDFGIAKATTDQRLTDKTIYTAFEQFIGTPAYMSPEQAEMSGLDVDTRSDIYSLGVLLYELLAGSPPFDPADLTKAGVDEIRRKIRNDEPPKPSTRLSALMDPDLTTVASRRQAEPFKLIRVIRGDLDWIVMKALEKDRTRRYETASGLALDVQRHLRNEPVVAGPPSRIYRIRKTIRRNRLLFTTAAVVLVSLILGIAASLWQAVRAARAESASNAAFEELRRAAPIFVEQARKLVLEERYDEALDRLNYAIKLKPDEAEYLVAKADLMRSQTQLREAAGLYKAALRIDPHLNRAKVDLALCEKLTQDGSKDLAREDLLELLESMQQEQRPAAELLAIARRLDRANEYLVKTWMVRLKELPITPERPLEDRFRLREGQLELDLTRTAIADLTPLRDLPLDFLHLGNTQVKSLDPIRNSVLSRTLRRIHFPFTGVTDVSPLEGCAKLEDLDTVGTQVSDFRPVQHLRLKQIWAGWSPLSDLSPFVKMPLEGLLIGNCPHIQDVSPLGRIKTLRGLILPDQARNVEALRSLPHLHRLGFKFVDGVGADKTVEEFWADWDKEHPQVQSTTKFGNPVTNSPQTSGREILKDPQP